MGLLGYSTISLTDLTEVLPASLYLSSSLVSNSQTKEGSNYTPDFSQNGNEVIITPSFFMGTEEITKKDGEADCPYKTNIRYQCGEVDENGNEITYSYMVSGADNYIWVDSDARLHYKKNLTKSIVIEAWIEGWIDTENQISYPNIPALNPINILLLTETGGYSAFIASKDGREHFEEGNESAITLVASLYNGATKVAINNCKWYQASNVDADGNLIQLETNEENGITVNGNELTVRRKAVKTLDTFICEITISTGLVFRVSMNLLDKTDSYYGNIIADGSLILTPEHNSINLTSQLWSGIELINSDDTNAARFKYKWFYLKDNERKEVGTARELKVRLTDKDAEYNFIYPQKDSFIIYCQAEIDGKTYVLSNISIQYSPVVYNVQKRPETFFVPTLNGGVYYSSKKVFRQTVSFKLVGTDGQTLVYNNDTDRAPFFSEKEITPFEVEVVSAGANKWNFNITFTYDPSKDTDKKFNGLENSFYLTFNYAYLGVQFQDEFMCVKNEAGIDGADGAPAYTVYLENEFVSFSADSLGELSGSEQSYTIKPSVFLGAEEKNYTITKITPTEGLTTTISGDNQNVKVVIDKNNITALLNKPNGTIPIEITTDGLTFVRTITYSVRFSSINYYLQLSANTFTRDLMYTFTPAQITISALYKRSGQEAPNACTSGYMLLTTYGEGGVYITKRNHVIGGSISNILTITGIDLNVSVKYFVVEFYDKQNGTLYDRQTIPVLVDSGDIEIGGVNLLRYTKKMPSRTISGKEYWWLSNAGEWGNNSIVDIPDEEGKMAELNYYGTVDKWVSFLFFQSMDMPIEGFASCYTLTFDIYSDNYSGYTNDFVFNVALHCNGGTHDTRWRWRDIEMLQGSELKNGFHVINGELVSGKWARVAFTFSPKFNNTFFNLPETPLEGSYDTVKYISFGFYNYTNCNVKIKKIKLEKGNIPTDWSESPYDVEYENIKGTNLLSTNYKTEIRSRNLQEDYAIDLDAGDYTLSWDATRSFSSSSETLLRGTFSPTEGVNFITQNSYTFTLTKPLKAFEIYSTYDASDVVYTMYALKLEKGTSSTPYNMTPEEVQRQYEESQNGFDDKVKNIVQVMDKNGEIKNYTDEEFKKLTESITEINNNYTSLESKYQTLLTTVNGYSVWESWYDLSQENGRTRLIIGDKSGEQIDFKMRLDSERLSFLNGNTEVSYISNEKLYINYAEIIQQMRIGSSSNTGYLVFKHMSGGLGVVWET